MYRLNRVLYCLDSGIHFSTRTVSCCWPIAIWHRAGRCTASRRALVAPTRCALPAAPPARSMAGCLSCRNAWPIASRRHHPARQGASPASLARWGLNTAMLMSKCATPIRFRCRTSRAGADFLTLACRPLSSPAAPCDDVARTDGRLFFPALRQKAACRPEKFRRSAGCAGQPAIP